MVAFTKKMSRFESLWAEEGNKKSWEVISVNLADLFYRFISLSNQSEHAMELQNKLYSLVELFEELPDHHKIAFYNEAMKNRVPTILGRLDEYVHSLKETNPDAYNDYKIHKSLVEIDRRLETQKELDKYLQALQEARSDVDN